MREIAGGLAIVYPWVAGEVLSDPYVPGALPSDSAESALSRFRRLPVSTIVRVLDTTIDAHVEVARRGFVAVDLGATSRLGAQRACCWVRTAAGADPPLWLTPLTGPRGLERLIATRRLLGCSRWRGAR